MHTGGAPPAERERLVAPSRQAPWDQELRALIRFLQAPTQPADSTTYPLPGKDGAHNSRNLIVDWPMPDGVAQFGECQSRPPRATLVLGKES